MNEALATGSQAVVSGNNAIREFLQREDVKQALAGMAALGNQLRNSRLAAITVSVYVSLAAVAHAKEVAALALETEQAEKSFVTNRGALEQCDLSEPKALQEVTEAQEREIAAQREVATCEVRLEQAKRLETKQLQASAVARHIDDTFKRGEDELRVAQQTLDDTEKELKDAQNELAAARHEFLNYRPPESRRPEDSLLHSPEQLVLKERVRSAGARVVSVETRRDALVSQMTSLRDSVSQRPHNAVRHPGKDTPSAETVDTKREAYVKTLYEARGNTVKAQGGLAALQRQCQLDRAKFPEVSARRAGILERQSRPSMITLPIVGIPLNPKLFFDAAPFLICLVLIEMSLKSDASQRPAAWLRGSASRAGLPMRDVLPLIPELRLDLASALPTLILHCVPLVSLGVLAVGSRSWIPEAVLLLACTYQVAFLIGYLRGLRMTRSEVVATTT